MAESPSPAELPQMTDDDILDEDLEIMDEVMEDLTFQLTWMAYEMVALRTEPGIYMQNLQKTYEGCRAALCGDSGQDPDVVDKYPETDSPTPPQM